MGNRQTQGWKVLLTVAALMWVCATAALADTPQQFVSGTTVNEVSIGGLTVEEAKAKIQMTYTDTYRISLEEADGKKEVITGAEFGYSAAVPGVLEGILNQQNASGRQWGPSVDNSHMTEIPAVYNEKMLEERIQKLNCISSGDIVKSVDARVSEYEEGKPFTIIPEVKGNDVDVSKVTVLIKTAVSVGKTEVNLESEGCYNTPKVYAGDERLEQLCQVMNQCKDIVISYNFGEALPVEYEAKKPDNAEAEGRGQERSVTEELTGAVICTWLTGTVDGEITVSREKAAAYVAGLAKKYDTAGTTRAFRTSGGKSVNLTGPYGWKIDQAGEIDALIAAIRTGRSQTRVPLYAKKASSRTAPDWGNTYVEIDLTSQHVYMYQDGVLNWNSACVTGNISKDYTTPAGIYSLAYKEKSRVLRGAKRADGTYEYESYVNFWMPFNGGIGLHDASWRTRFGGEIYKKGGSHGCINLPPIKTKDLYDLVYKGIPVICYN